MRAHWGAAEPAKLGLELGSGRAPGTWGLALVVPAVWLGRGWRLSGQQEEATRTRLTRMWSLSTQQGSGLGKEPHR